MQCIVSRNNLNKLAYYDETKKAYGSQIEFKKAPNWATVGLVIDNHQEKTTKLNIYARAVIKSEAWPTIVQLKGKS